MGFCKAKRGKPKPKTLKPSANPKALDKPQPCGWALGVDLRCNCYYHPRVLLQNQISKLPNPWSMAQHEIPLDPEFFPLGPESLNPKPKILNPEAQNPEPEILTSPAQKLPDPLSRLRPTLRSLRHGSAADLHELHAWWWSFIRVV